MNRDWISTAYRVVDVWGDGVVRASWQGGLLILGVWLICRLFPRLPAAARCWLWWLACLKLVVGLLWSAALPLPLLPAPAPAPPATLPAAVAVEDGVVAPPIVVLPPGDAAEAAPVPADQGLPLRPAALCLVVWLAVVAARLGGIGYQLARVERLLRSAAIPRATWLLDEAARLAAAMRLRRTPRLRESAGAPGPLVAGLLRPTVLLPAAAAERFSPTELRMALAHELAHLRRGDLQLSLVPHLAQLLFFFHPLVVLACREWAMAREAACDAAALQATGEPPIAYGRLLVKLAASHRGAALPALGATAGYRTLQRRLKMLELTSLSPRRWWRVGLAVLGITGALCVIPWRLVARAAPPTVRPLAASVSPVVQEQLSACEVNLREIGRALAAYQRDHGALPVHLSDLFPQYIADLKRFHCPADRTDGSPRRADDYDDEIAPPADPRPVSYAYMMSPVRPHVGFGGLGGPLPRNADWSWRGQMMAMRANYGDRVPVVRCWHHAQTMYEAATRPLIPNLTLEGAVYRSAYSWQMDPGTLAVVIGRMENDLAQGATPFLKRWNLGAIAGQFSHSESIPSLRARSRVLAAKLERLAGQPLKAAQVTHPATDLPAAAGSLYRMAGDTDRAIAAYQQAIDHLDRTVNYYHGGEISAAGALPALYAAKGQHEKAIAVYQRIALKDPEKPDWYLAMAREYEYPDLQPARLTVEDAGSKIEPCGIEPAADEGRACGQRATELSAARVRIKKRELQVIGTIEHTAVLSQIALVGKGRALTPSRELTEEGQC